MWMIRFIEQLTKMKIKLVKINIDNKSSIELAKNQPSIEDPITFMSPISFLDLMLKITR